jgi:dihydrofolate synthase/folylpolyglutamate synthase
MGYKECIDYLYGRQLFGMKLGLENISELMKKLDNPEQKFKSVHIAGTNGKGSTAAMLERVLREAGYKTGLYTSPHLVDFKERIRINGKKIKEDELIDLVTKIKPMIKDETFFEVVTAIAFEHFKNEKVDIAIIEVGLGGRLDATNVIRPELSIITNISLDHVQHLGGEIDKVAYEKAGIIKRDSIVIVPKKINGLKVIQKVSKLRDASLLFSDKCERKIGLLGDYQKINAGIVIKAVSVLNKNGFNISDKNVDDGLLNAKWPGRMQYVKENILFDCAHNPEGIENLVKELKCVDKDIYFVIGIMKDKDIKSMCDALKGLGKEYILVQAKIERAAEPKIIKEFLNEKIMIIPEINKALEYAEIKAKNNGLVVVTGSIFTIGECFTALGFEPFDS